MTQRIQIIEELYIYVDEIISRKFFWMTVMILFIGNVLVHCGIVFLAKFAYIALMSSVLLFGMIYGLRECISALPFLFDFAVDFIGSADSTSFMKSD